MALTARRADRLERLAEDIGLRHGVETLTFAADLYRGAGRDPGSPRRPWPGVNALVNNAGYGQPGTYADTTWEQQAAVLQVMLTAPSELAHRVLPGMVDRRFGRIVNVASLAVSTSRLRRPYP